MKPISIHIEVQTGAKSGPTAYTLQIERESPTLSDVLNDIARTEWGRPLFKEDQTGLRPGHLVVLNNRAIQPWEADSMLVSDGCALSIVPFVAGG